jgi:hypothetical protein
MSAYDLRRHLIPANPAKPPTSGDPGAVGSYPITQAKSSLRRA